MPSVSYVYDGTLLQQEQSYMAWQAITDPTSDQYRLREEAGMNFDADGFGMIDGRYVVACSEKFGNVGDYVDWTLENGVTVHSVIGDTKNPNDPEYVPDGHLDRVGDSGPWTHLSVIEWIMDGTYWYQGSGRSVVAYRPQFASRAVSTVSVGNFWGNRPGGYAESAGSTAYGNITVVNADKWYRGSKHRVTYIATSQPDGYLYFNDDVFYRCRTDGTGVQLRYIDQTDRWVDTSVLQGVMVSSASAQGMLNAGGMVAPTGSVEAAVQWAIDIANNPNFGYSWVDRDGQLDSFGRGSYDCSSLIYHAFQGFGVLAQSGGVAGTTDTMQADFTACGFQFLPGYGNDESQLQRGDILVVTSGEDKHTVLYIGNHQFVSASSPETGDVYVNDKGDQTGQEIWVQPYYSWPWEFVLRYGGTN